MPVENKPVPKDPHEIINETIVPYDLLGEGNPNISENRGNDVSVRKDTVKEVNIGLLDIYKSLSDYIKNVIKPTVIENNEMIAVPVEYAYGERWNEVQKNGFLRDKEGLVLLPMIVIKRDNITPNRTLGNKLDGNKVQLYQSFQTQYSRKNTYDNFAVLTNRIPVKEYHIAPVPDYVTITYNASILANSQEQVDEVIQAFNWVGNSFWGQLDRFKFKVSIDAFTDTLEYSQGEDRSVKSDFNIVVNGYLLPDNVNRFISSKRKVLSKAVLKFAVEVLPLSSVVTNVPEIITNDFLIANGIYLVNSNGVRLNVAPKTVVTNDFLSSTNSHLINSNGLKIQID